MYNYTCPSDEAGKIMYIMYVASWIDGVETFYDQKITYLVIKSANIITQYT